MLYLLAFATVFYVAAHHERLGGARWAAYSVGITVLFLFLVPNLYLLFLFQAVLFALLWRVNVLKAAKRSSEMKQIEEEMRADRRERLRQAREEFDKQQLEEDAPQTD